MTTAQVVERSVTVNNKSPIQDYVHPDDQTQPFEMTPGFKPFTQCNKLCNIVRNLNSTAISQNVTLKMMDLLLKQVQKFHTYNESLPKLG